VFVAALLIQSAAIDATAAAAQSRKNRKRTGGAATTAAVAGRVKSSPEQATETLPVSAPTPAADKANSRESGSVPAQQQQQSPAESAGATSRKADEPTANALRYAYEFKQPDFNIRRILIEHDAEGRGHVSFVRKDSEELFTDPLQIPPAALARLLAAWDALKFLDSEANYQSERQFPHLGEMTLRMKHGARERKAEFNWTNDAGVAALVKEYRGIGEQQLFIFDVNLARQYQPSDTVKIFMRLESLLKRGELSDTAPLVPVLRDLTTDERIPLMARNHAARLLKKIEK